MGGLSTLSDPGICKYTFCLARPPLLPDPLDYLSRGRHQGLLKQILRPRTALSDNRRQSGSLPQEKSSRIPEKQMVPIRFFNLLSCDVFSDAVEYLSGVFRSFGLKTSCQTVVDLQTSLALGISRDSGRTLGCTIFLWLLQCHADFNRTRAYHHAPV